ncbi:hypothetical protein [Simplicispira suum]|uniref:hypothetical protein n=1 Tax=Simplicispira suum TaxID=2109915 RepID=UPI0011B1DEED|nr:hypothetical protein [Simplicispira suum]
MFAKTVDVDRLARNLVAEGLQPTKGAALNLAARLLGASNHHALLAQAKAPKLATWSIPDIQEYLSSEAITTGSRFPKELPPQFDGAWQHRATALLAKAVAARTPGELEFIALVGGPGSGKTLLAKHFCKLSGGCVVDVGLYRWFTRPYQPAAGEIVVFDRPALPRSAPSASMARAFELWSHTAPRQRTVERAKELFRSEWQGIPMDAPGESIHGSIARNLAQAAPLIVCFASPEEAQHALDGSARVISMYSPAATAKLNWRAAHLVNLDNLSEHTLLRAPPEKT